MALESCEDENLHLCMMLAIVCSMRIGEILGLQWDSVDLTGEASLENSPSLTVKQELKRCDINSLEQTKNQTDPREMIYMEFPTRKKTGKAKTVLVLKSPKTNSSNRPLYFGPTMLEALKKHQELQNEEKRKSGEMYNDYDLVIAHPDGSPVEARFIEKNSMI